jgi:pseudaminic acid synthase
MNMLNKEFKIGNFIINESSKPFIIAEMSGNHNKSLSNALAIVDAAAKAGVNAIKLQTYKPETITVDADFAVNDPDSLWKNKNLFKLYEDAYTPWEWHKEIFEYATKKGLIAFSSPFDETAVDFLETLNVPAYKIASFENNDWPLLRKVAQTGKPVIISSGASKLCEIDEALTLLRKEGVINVVLLKCTSTYPAPPDSTNLKTMVNMQETFNCFVGLSDHTLGIGVSVAAAALGAKVIEKHITLDRNDGGVDSAFSMEPQEFAQLVIEVDKAHKCLGKVSYGVSKVEEKSVYFKRSLFAVQDIAEGDYFTNENVKSRRPNVGIISKNIDMVIGKKAAISIKKGSPIFLNAIKF